MNEFKCVAMNTFNIIFKINSELNCMIRQGSVNHSIVPQITIQVSFYTTVDSVNL